MKKTIAFLCIFVLISMGIQADVYIKGILHVDGGYRYGHNVPEMDVVNEWWIGENKVTFISTGWRYHFFIRTDWRFTLDREGERIIVANLSEKWFVEVPLPMNLLSHVDQSLAGMLDLFQINGRVEKTGEKKTINQKACDVYEVSEWIIQGGDDRYYERKRTVMATSDVPFNWQIVNELYQWIRSFPTVQKSYLSELNKLKGFVLAENNVLSALGYQVKWSFRVLEIDDRKAEENIYGIPKDFKKKEKFTQRDLLDMVGVIYPRPIY